MRVVLVLLISVLAAQGQIAFIGNAKASAASTSTATTASADTTGANLAVVVACGYASSSCTNGAGGMPMSDSKTNTWQRATPSPGYSAGNGNICIFYSELTSVGSGHTFSLQAGLGGSYPTVFAGWYSGAASSSSKDQHNGAGSSSGTTLQPGSVTPSTNGQLVVTGICDGASVHTRSVDTMDVTPWKDNANNNSFSTGAWSYQIQTTATAVNPTWTVGGSGVGRAAAIATFKAPGAAAGVRRRGVLVSGH